LSIKYRAKTELVLKNLNLKINANEKVGVVGRTGAGKSSLVLALIRILEASEGNILIDKIDISEIGLNKLRNVISVIPQDCFIFEGTLQNNIDPFEEYSQEQIIETLERVDLAELIQKNEKGLEMKITEGGENLSAGEKQLISVARAILKKSIQFIFN
jgi:ATP-binding cassette, subfamily C (CFTR/MRP), member 1